MQVNSPSLFVSLQPSRPAPILQDYKALASALQRGDVKGAQSGLSALLRDFQVSFSTVINLSKIEANNLQSPPPVSNDIKSLSDALQTGDLARARNTFKTLQKDLQSIRSNPSINQNSSQSPFPSDSNDAPSHSDQVSTDLKNLSKAFQSDDLTGARGAFKAFQQDFQSTPSKAPGSILNIQA